MDCFNEEKANGYFFMSKLAEQAGKYEDSLNFLKDMIDLKIEQVNEDERNHLLFTNYYMVNERRRHIKYLIAKEKKENNLIYFSFIQEYKEKIRREICLICIDTLKMISLCFEKCNDDESRGLYLTIMGDYNKIIAEFTSTECKIEYSEKALKLYFKAKNFPKDLMSTLKLTENISTIYHDFLTDKLKAKNILKNFITDYQKELNSLDTKEYDSENILSKVKDFEEKILKWDNDA